MRPSPVWTLLAVLTFPALARAGDATFTETLRMVSERLRPLDWAEVFGGPERVVYFGECHQHAVPRDLLAANVDAMLAAGITHLGIEFWEDLQPALDRFAASGQEGAELEAALQRTRRPESWRRLLGAARGKLAVIALDMSPQAAAALAAEGLDFMAVTQARDGRMIERIHATLTVEPGRRMLVLGGVGHSSRTRQPDRLEESHGYKTKRFFPMGPGRYWQAAEELGLTRAAGLLPLPRQQSPYDLILHPDAIREAVEDLALACF